MPRAKKTTPVKSQKKGKKRARKPNSIPPPELPPPTPPPLERNPDNPSRPTLTLEEEAFVAEYLRHFRAGRAYRTVHPHVTRQSARVMGCRWLAKDNIQAEIKAEMDERKVRHRVRADKVIKAAMQLLTSDMGDCYDANNNLLPVNQIPPETRRWLQSYKQQDSNRTIGTGKKRTVIRESTRECKLVGKATAFNVLVAHLGLNDKMPPIEIILAMLPKEAADVLRQLLAPHLESQPTQPKQETPKDAIAVTAVPTETTTEQSP